MGIMFYVPLTCRLLLQRHQSAHVRLNMQKSPYCLHFKQPSYRLHLQLIIPRTSLKVIVLELEKKEKYGIVDRLPLFNLYEQRLCPEASSTA